MTDLNSAKSVDDQIAAAEALQRAWMAAAEARKGVSKEEDAFLGKIAQVIKSLRQLQAIDENAAGKEQARNAAEDLERRAELQRTILQFGEQSAEVRAVDARQEREALTAKLDGLGIARDSEEAARALAALQEVQLAREAEALEMRCAWLRGKQDEVDAIRLEISLIGVTNAKAERARALAEAELEIRDEKLGLLDAILARVQAIARAEAQAQLERAKAVELLRLDSISDQFDARMPTG